MADQNINVNITGDSTSLVTAVDKAADAIEKDLIPAADKAGAAAAGMGREVEKVSAPINKVASSFEGLNNVVSTVGDGLKQTLSGLAKGALVGAAVTAVSVLTKALLEGGKEAKAYAAEMAKVAEKAKATKDEFERVNNVVKTLSGTLSEKSSVAAAGAAAELANVSSLVGVIQNQTKSYSERNNALNALKSINKSYFGDLTLEAASLATLTGKVNEYSQALINAEITRAFAADIAKNAVETSKALNVFNRLGNEIDNINRRLLVIPKASESVTKVQYREYITLTDRLRAANEEYSIQVGLLGDLKTASLVSGEGFNTALEEGLKFKPLETPTGAGGSGEKAIDKLIAKAKILAKELDFKFVVPELEITSTKDKNQLAKDAQKFLDDAAAGKLKLKVDRIAYIGGETGKEALLFSISDAFKKTPFEIQMESIKLKPKRIDVSAAVKKLNEGGKQSFAELLDLSGLDKQTKELATTLNETLTPAFTGMFDAIFAGEAPLKAFFNGILDAINQVIKKLIAAAIQAAILSVILPGGGGGFPKIFKNLLGIGGTAASPTNFGSGRSQAFGSSLVATVRGTDLAFVLQQGQNSIGRVG